MKEYSLILKIFGYLTTFVAVINLIFGYEMIAIPKVPLLHDLLGSWTFLVGAVIVFISYSLHVRLYDPVAIPLALFGGYLMLSEITPFINTLIEIGVVRL